MSEGPAEVERSLLVCSLLSSPCRQLRFSPLESTVLGFLYDSFSAAKELLQSGTFCFFLRLHLINVLRKHGMEMYAVFIIQRQIHILKKGLYGESVCLCLTLHIQLSGIN